MGSYYSFYGIMRYLHFMICSEPSTDAISSVCSLMKKGHQGRDNKLNFSNKSVFCDRTPLFTEGNWHFVQFQTGGSVNISSSTYVGVGLIIENKNCF